MRKRYAITLSSAFPLRCRVTIDASTELAVDALCAQFSRAAVVTERWIEALYTEPLEVVVAAQQLTRTMRGHVKSVVASPMALELLDDATEPTLSAWRWLLGTLEVDPPKQRDDGFVAVTGLGALPLERRSGIVLSYPPRRADGPYDEVTPARIGIFDKDRIVLGSDDDADIQVIMPHIQRRHCELVRRGDAWYFHDLESNGAVLFDYAPVLELRLVPGDSLYLRPEHLGVVAIL